MSEPAIPDEDDSEDGATEFRRETARYNPTVTALMRRGLPDDLAKKLHTDGHTLAALQQMPESDLTRLGLTAETIAAIKKGGRAIIPFDSLAKVLWANRYVCCVCRERNLSIILHHIEPWATSFNHSPDNLAVLCLEHHAKAHTTGTLGQNLTARQLKDFKLKWEAEVGALDARAILDASRQDSHHWLWFNHVRLFEIAERMEIRLPDLTGYREAVHTRMIDRAGYPTGINDNAPYRYAGGDGRYLYQYVRSLMEAVLEKALIYNVSDDLDPGFLGSAVRQGDLILVQGKHSFKRIKDPAQGPGQVSQVRRTANGVRVSFTIDRWEAVSTSAWGSWLLGTQRCASILRIAAIEREGSKLHLRCTGIATGTFLDGLSTRVYAYPAWPEPNEDISDDDFLDFGDLDDNLA